MFLFLHIVVEVEWVKVSVAEYWPSDSFDDRPRITYSIHPVFLESEHHSCGSTPFLLQRSNVVVDSALETSVLAYHELYLALQSQPL